MSVELTLNDIHAYAEVDYIINHMNIKYKEMIPEKLLNFFSEYKEPNLNITINPYIPLQEQGLSKYALEIIALLHLKYWCEDENRKQELYSIMLANQEKISGQAKNRFDIESLFPDAENIKNSSEGDSQPKTIQKIEIPEPVVEERIENNSQEKNLPSEHSVRSDKGIFGKIKKIFIELFCTKN